MKTLLLSLVFFGAHISGFAQVLLDKPLQLSGAGSDARIEGIKAVIQPQDAVSAEVIQHNDLSFGISSNTGNAYSVTLSPAISALTAGQVIHFQSSAANTGAATLNVNGTGPKEIRKNFDVPLASNDLKAGQMISVMYDAVNDRFQMLSQLGNPAGSGSGSPQRYLGEEYLGGIIFYLYNDANGNQKGLIVSKTETAAAWQTVQSTTGATRSWDGAFNTNLMTNSPARNWINNNFNTGGLNAGAGVWYLPSIDELSYLWHNRLHVNKAASALGSPPLSMDAWYWSSTEYNSGDAWYFRFLDGAVGETYGSYKGIGFNVRAVRAF